MSDEVKGSIMSDQEKDSEMSDQEKDSEMSDQEKDSEMSDEGKNTGLEAEVMGTGSFDDGKDGAMSDDVVNELRELARSADSGLKCMMGFTAGLEVAERPVPDALAMVKERLLEVRNGCLQLRLQLADCVKKSGAKKVGAGEGVAE